MDVFALRDRLIADYAEYIESFITISDTRIRQHVDRELDASYFHLYGISRDDIHHILETFPIVKWKDEAVHGEYRTKRVILEVYDAMQRAMDTGQLYQTLLDPPSTDPRVAHPPGS